MTPLPIINDPVHGPSLLIDNSSLERLLCSREFEYSYVENLIPNHDRSALNFGSAIHGALALRYKLCGSSQVEEAQALAINSFLCNHFTDHPQPDGDFRTLALATRLIEQYNKTYKNESFKILGNANGPHIEHSFIHELGTVEFPYVYESIEQIGNTVNIQQLSPSTIKVFFIGRIDMIIEDHGCVLIVDHKTTSMYGESFWDDMKMSAQFRGYCWAYLKSYGVKPWGYMIDALRIRRATREEAREIEYTGELSVRRDDFVRDTFPISDDAIDEWQTNTLSKVRQVLYHASNDYFPMSTKQCRHKYGRCDFYDICSVPRENRRTLLESGMFLKNEWSPLNKPQPKEN